MNPWNKVVVEMLKEKPEEAQGYLNSCAGEGLEVFIAGLRNVVKARGGLDGLELRINQIPLDNVSECVIMIERVKNN